MVDPYLDWVDTCANPQSHDYEEAGELLAAKLAQDLGGVVMTMYLEPNCWYVQLGGNRVVDIDVDCETNKPLVQLRRGFYHAILVNVTNYDALLKQCKEFCNE